MENEPKDAKEEEAQPTPDSSPEEQKQAPIVSEDAKTQEADTEEAKPEGKSYQEKYEEARKAMQNERESKREALAKTKELEERLEAGQAKNTEAPTYRDEDKNSVLKALSTDKFAQENIDLIIGKMEENAAYDVVSAIHAVKSDILDKIQADEGETKPEVIKSEKPTATEQAEVNTPAATSNRLEDALAGKMDIDPAQAETIRRMLGR